MRSLLKPCLLASCAVLATAAGPLMASERLPDGRWHITLRGQGPNIFCYGQVSGVGEVRGGRPVYRGEAKYRFHLARNGMITASGSRRNDHASLRGQIRGKRTGSGTFEVPTRNCKGTWQVVKIGD